MRRWLPLLVLLLAGCANWYTVPPAEYRQRVKILGVLPLLVDAGADIDRPDRREVLELLRRHSAGKDAPLVEALREARRHFDVRPVSGDPRELFRRLGAVRSARGYRVAAEGVAALAEREAVDGLLVVVLYGEERNQVRRDRKGFDYLEAPFAEVRASASVVAPAGETLWAYDDAFLPLQYPDFDEAHYNRSDTVQIRNLSLPGLERALAEPSGGLFARGELPERYRELVDAIAGALGSAWRSPFAADP